MSDQKTFKFFADLIFKHTGMFFAESDYYRLEGRLNALMIQFEKDSMESLMHMYQATPTAQQNQALIDIATNNETYFFRDTKPFTALTDEVFEDLSSKYPGSKLQIWSCAASTGQESLSIIMQLLESNLANKDQFEITATDISDKALTKARNGIYSKLDVQRGLPIQLLMKYFEKSEDSWKFKDEFKKFVKFDTFNLLTGSFPVNKYHIIYCRNVLIYQNQENKKIILEKLFEALKPGGYLIMGAGESMIGMDLGFEQKTVSSTMVFLRPDSLKTAA
jgi:chemotaxis protein methyltransferase CheR